MSSQKYEVVISGMGGIFPGCEDINDFESKLFNKEEMVENSKYWDSEVVGVPSIVGKCKNSCNLDFTYFGLHYKLFEGSDPLCTQNLKYAFEAICDAGINPFTLNDTKTAVIMACSTSETEMNVLFGKNLHGRYRGIIGQSKAMQANRISYFLNLRGPSYVIDDTWAGGLQALQIGYRLISSGLCNAALIGTASNIFGPEFSYQFHAMGKLNSDGKTKCFTAEADGYTRSEGFVVFFLQRAEDAKRSYGTIVNVLTCNYGVRTTPYPEFSPELYTDLLLRVYEEAQIDPSEVCYIEADGSASEKMDALELNCISEVMCANRKTPLSVGSVKSNIGHTEAASGLASIVKVLMAFKSGFIPPNLHYSSPNPDVPALLSGQMEVVTEPTPLNGNIVGVSSIGLSGSYGHVIIKQNSKIKTNLKQTSSSNIPWLFIISGRNAQSLKKVIEKVEVMPFNEQFIALTHHVFKSHLKGYYFRGYTLLNTDSERKYEIKEYNAGEKRPVWFLFSGMGSQWPGMGADLMRLPIFARAINHCHEVLLSKGINLLEIINSTDPHIFDCILNSFIGITAIQIGLVDVLRELGIEPDGIIGHSLGELGCAYADGCFTAEQAILGAYARGKASLEVPLIRGMMAAIGMGYNQIKDQLPPTIEVACHNSKNSCTLSGPAEDMEQFVASLKIRGIFAKLVNVCNIAYHSRYIKALGPGVFNYLKKVIPEPKQRTKRWISSSVPESSWDNDLAKFSSAEYHTNNLLNPVLFEEASAHIPDKSIVIEIAPRGLLQSIVRKSLFTCTNIPLANRSEKDNLAHLFTAIGKIYLQGVDVNIDNLHPKIEFPLFGPIPSLGPLLTWKSVTPTLVDNLFKSHTICQSQSDIDLSDKHLEKYYGHSVCGRQVIPFALLLNLALEKFKKLNQATANQDKIEIKNLWFNEEFEVLDNLSSEITLQVQRSSGLFEIRLNTQILVLGQICFLESDNEFSFSTQRGLSEQPLVEMSHNEIYKYFEEYSIKFNDNFKSIQKVCFNKTEINAIIQWKGDWIVFLDAVMMLVSLSETVKHNQFQRVNYIRQFYINFAYFNSFSSKEITVSYNKLTQELSCGGLKLHLPLTRDCSIKSAIPKLARESRQFLPYYTTDSEHYGQIDDCFQIIFQNTLQYKDKPKKLKVILFDDDGDDIYNHLLTYYNQVDIITLPTEDILNQLYLNLNKTDNLLLIGAHPTSKTALTCLKKVAVGFVLLKDKLEIENLDNLYPVFKFKFNNMKLALHKMCYEGKQAVNTIKFGNNNKWKSDLKLSLEIKDLEDNSLKTIYLLGKVNSIFKIHEIVQYCLSLENANMIRFIFLDDKSPSFSLDQPFYKKQIAMDLVMNICVNRTWGCLKVSTPTVKSSSIPLESQHESIYSISSIKSENVTLYALGLNLMAFTENSNVEKLGAFDYCGVDKTGNTICGVGILSDGKELNEDKILRWRVPQNWTYEEAVSIPICYTTAYYILRKKDFSPVNKNTILVHRGGLLVSQAIIHVALSRGCEVFTTYTTVEEKHLIHQLFPQINHSNIYFCKSFEAQLLNKTNGKGVHIVVEANDDPAMLKSSMLVLSRRGLLYLLNRKVINEKNKIGMLHFLKELTVKGLITEILLDQHPSTKCVIQKDVETGISEGHVKPLRTFTLSTNTLNIEAIDMLNSKDGYSNKVVALMECSEKQSLQKELFICSGQKCQVILSTEGSFWLDLLNWLLCRGARNVHLFNEFHNMDGSTSLRFLGILNNYPSADISSHPKRKCSSLRTLVTNINSQQEISEVFCLGKMPEDEINSLDTILKDINSNTRLICIGNGGEAVCELRNKNNIPGLAISCELQLMKGSIILPELDRIINYCRDDSVITLSEEDHYKKAEFNNLAACQRRLPDDITELLSLHKKLVPKACFIETMTMCAPYKYNKELDPIFIIPSLKPNEMDKLISRLQHPTFEARLPQEVDEIDIIAKDLFEDMKRFKFNVFTIIANEWGGAVGLNLAKYLENSGKLVLLILLNSSPNSVRSWASAVLQMGDDNLIDKYLKLPYKIRHKLSLLSNWNEKLDFSLKSSIEEEADREEIRKTINILRKCLLSSMKYNTGDELFQGKCIVYRTKDSTQDDSIKECCRMPPVINTIDSRDHIEMLEDPQFAKIINGLIPFEHKTAAHGLKCESFGVNINKSIRSCVAEMFTKMERTSELSR